MTASEATSVEAASLWSEVAGLLAIPLLILDLAGHLLASNTAGEALISGSFALQVNEGRLVPRRQSDCLNLEVALAALHTTTTGSVVCNLPNRDGTPNLLLHMRRLGGTPSRVLALVKDVASPQPQAAALVAASFGLTKAETRVATLLSAGLSLAEIADQLGVGTGTVRNQLKRAMRKTGTGSQAQLALVVVRGMESA